MLAISLALFGCDEPKDTNNDPVVQPMETNPYIQNQKLQRSINLGNILEAPAEGEWGLSLEAVYFELIANAGFTGVRLPVRWSTHADTVAPYTLDPQFLGRVDWAIAQAFENDLAIVVNVHHYEEMMTDPVTHLPRLLSIWHQLASHYQDYEDDLILELFNEPHNAFTSQLWNQYLTQLVDTIRTVDTSRTLMIGTAPWGGIDGLDNLELPADTNLIVTVHYYNPFQFTHQGASWSTGSDAWLGTTWGSTDDYNNLQQDFNRLKSWAETNQRPMNVGEFGAYNRAGMTSRQNWTRAVVNISESMEFSWMYWEFASGFGAFNKDTYEWNELLSALIQN